MLKYLVNDKKTDIPTCWEEATARHFQNIYRIESEDREDPIRCFGALTGMPFVAVAESTNEDLDAAVYQVTAFIFNQPQKFRDVAPPEKIRLLGKNVIIPKDLGKLTVAQNFHIRAAIAKSNNLESLISLAAAIYLQPLIDGAKFNITRAKEIEEHILDMNIFEIFPVGFFWLSKLNNSGASGLLGWLLNKLTRLSFARLWQSSLALSVWILFTMSASLIAMPKPMDSSRELFKKSLSMSSSHSSTSGDNRRNFRSDSTQSKNNFNL
jgi:hypothetical protein